MAKSRAQKVRERLETLSRLLLVSDDETVREQTRQTIKGMLERGRKTPNDLANLLKSESTDPSWGACWSDAEGAAATTSTSSSTPPPPPPPPPSSPQVNVLDLVLRLIEMHIALTPEQRMATALWILHTHVFDRYRITPRLALLSPVPGCGKTNVLILAEALSADPYRSENVSAAAVYHTLWEGRHTLLLDEGDNLGLFNNKTLRAVLNSGHRRGASISRVIRGRPCKIPLFSPLAIAAIGLLPWPLLSRAIVVNMQRAPGDAQLQEPDELDPTLAASHTEIRKWATTCTLARDPEMPPGLYGREANIWRPLLAIADNLGHGEAARAAAVALCSDRLTAEDPIITLLRDIRTTFDVLGVDRLASVALIEVLLAPDDSIWLDWRGPRDDRPARKLTQTELARLLRPFGIRPRSFWPAQRLLTSKSSRGYRRDQFEAAWAAYCPDPATATPPQSRKINQLPRP